MRNEMGNNNTSEITKEEDKASDEVVKTENHMSPEASGAGLSSNDSSDDTKHLGECSESIEKGKEDRKPDSRFPQILTTELCNTDSVDSDFSIAESTNEGINEKIVELNLKESGLQINSQVCISEGEVGDSGGNKPAKTTSLIHGTANDPDKIHEKIQTLPVIQQPDSGIESVGYEIHLEENEEDFVQEHSDPLKERVLVMDTISEGKFGTPLNSQDEKCSLENEESESLAFIESENEVGGSTDLKQADSIKKTDIHRKIEFSAASVKEIEKQSMFPDLDEVSAISLTIATTENEKTTIFSSQLANETELDPLEEKVLEMDTICEGKFGTHLNSQDKKCSLENEESEFLALIESENEVGRSRDLRQADSTKKTDIHRKMENSTVPVKEIEKQSMFPDLDEVSAISLTIVTTENEKATIFSSQLGNECNEKGLGMIDQITLGTTAETETLSNQSNEENAIGVTSPLPNCDDTQELVEEVVIKSNGQKKPPSFDFDIPLVILKSEESDQTTPLLHHDKNASRSSFSGYSNIMHQNNILQNERGIIRMERSDSVGSRSSLMKSDEDVNVESAQVRKESHFSDEKVIELPAVAELALTKQKGRGNRKPKSPLFSTCICCTANFD